MGTLESIIGGVCELCHEKKELVGGDVFTKGTDNSINGPHKEKGFTHFEFIVAGCEGCIKSIDKLTKHMEIRDTDVYVNILRSDNGLPPFKGISDEVVILRRKS